MKIIILMMMKTIAPVRMVIEESAIKEMTIIESKSLKRAFTVGQFIGAKFLQLWQLLA